MAVATNYFSAPSAQFNVTCRSGTTYQAVAGVISNVASGDITDVINSGCRQIGAPDNGINLPAVAGRFYNPVPGITPGTLLTVLGVLYAFPFRFPSNIPIQTLSADVTTGQTGGKVRFGLYTDNNGAPGSLIAGTDSGDQVATGTAAATFTPTSPLVLPESWMWAALCATASSTMPSVSSIATGYGNDLPFNLGYDTLAHAIATTAEAGTGVSATFTYGALPATFPTAGYALTLNAATPLIVLGA